MSARKILLRGGASNQKQSAAKKVAARALQRQGRANVNRRAVFDGIDFDMDELVDEYDDDDIEEDEQEEFDDGLYDNDDSELGDDDSGFGSLSSKRYLLDKRSNDVNTKLSVGAIGYNPADYHYAEDEDDGDEPEPALVEADPALVDKVTTAQTPMEILEAVKQESGVSAGEQLRMLKAVMHTERRDILQRASVMRRTEGIKILREIANQYGIRIHILKDSPDQSMARAASQRAATALLEQARQVQQKATQVATKGTVKTTAAARTAVTKVAPISRRRSLLTAALQKAQQAQVPVVRKTVVVLGKRKAPSDAGDENVSVPITTVSSATTNAATGVTPNVTPIVNRVISLTAKKSTSTPSPVAASKTPTPSTTTPVAGTTTDTTPTPAKKVIRLSSSTKPTVVATVSASPTTAPVAKRIASTGSEKAVAKRRSAAGLFASAIASLANREG